MRAVGGLTSRAAMEVAPIHNCFLRLLAWTSFVCTSTPQKAVRFEDKINNPGGLEVRHEYLVKTNYCKKKESVFQRQWV